MNLMRVSNRPRRGSTAAIILLLLAFVCLIVALVGGYLAWTKGASTLAQLQSLATSQAPIVVVPGEGKVTGPGVLFIAAKPSETVDGKTYTYPPAEGAPKITITDAGGQDVRVENMQGKGNDRIQLPSGEVIYLVGFAELSSASECTVKAEGGSTALRLKTVTKEEGEAMKNGMVGAFGGVIGTCVGCGGFVVFGIIGAILFFFGKKSPTPT